MSHSIECRKQRAEWEALYEAYSHKWPNYCRHCGATGVVSWMENHGPWGECWLEQMQDVCSCMDSLQCPRCGQVVWTEEDFEKDHMICPKCGWHDDDPETWAPVEPDCLCHMIDLDYLDESLLRDDYDDYA